jgi:anti-sigma B factor antagonist
LSRVRRKAQQFEIAELEGRSMAKADAHTNGSLATIQVRVSERGPVLHVSGELDVNNSHLVVETVRSLHLDGQRTVAVDLTDLTFCDASALAAFIKASQHLRQVGGRLVITRASGIPRRVLTFPGVDKYLEVQ